MALIRNVLSEYARRLAATNLTQKWSNEALASALRPWFPLRVNVFPLVTNTNWSRRWKSLDDILMAHMHRIMANEAVIWR